MYHYGVLLENFNNNGEFVNNSIFTMMHHVGGDLSQLSSLFQPHILKSFSKMWETDYDLRDVSMFNNTLLFILYGRFRK